jgi:hypothetical protein
VDFSPRAPKIEKTPTVAIDPGGGAEAAIDAANKAMDGVTNTTVILDADLFPEGYMAVKQ